MNASVGDILNQGRFAIYVSNISEEGVLIQGNNLWVPETATRANALQYENLASALGVELGGWSFGAQFGDLNNDGFLDLYLTNGYVSPDREQQLLVRLLEGRRRQQSDHLRRAELAADGRPQPLRLPAEEGLAQRRRRPVHRSRADGRRDRCLRRPLGRAGRFQNRGVLDVVVANQNGPLLLYQNTVDARTIDWIEFELEGTASNRSAIGAQVRVFWNGQQQVQEVSGGSGFCAQNQRRLHFGLGKAASVDRVEIRWPSGKTQTIRAARRRTASTGSRRHRSPCRNH